MPVSHPGDRVLSSQDTNTLRAAGYVKPKRTGNRTLAILPLGPDPDRGSLGGEQPGARE
jgi:hypothetical protein